MAALLEEAKGSSPLGLIGALTHSKLVETLALIGTLSGRGSKLEDESTQVYC